MNNNLTEEDIKILLESIDSWVEKDLGATFMTTLLDGLLTARHDEKAKEEWENKRLEMEKNEKKKKR
jgi:hypothetical protein